MRKITTKGMPPKDAVIIDVNAGAKEVVAVVEAVALVEVAAEVVVDAVVNHVRLAAIVASSDT